VGKRVLTIVSPRYFHSRALFSYSLGQFAREPIESFVESLALGGTSGLNVPFSTTNGSEAEFL